MNYEELNFYIEPIDSIKGEIFGFNMVNFDKNWA